LEDGFGENLGASVIKYFCYCSDLQMESAVVDGVNMFGGKGGFKKIFHEVSVLVLDFGDCPKIF